MDIDQTLLKQVLVWVIGGGGSAALVYFVFEKAQILAQLQPEPKRYATLLAAAVVACLAFGAAVGLKYMVTPVGWQGWLESLFAVAFVAVGGSQALHGRLQLGADE